MIKEDIDFLLSKDLWVTVFPFNNGIRVGFANDIYHGLKTTDVSFPYNSFNRRNAIFSAAHCIQVYDTPEEAWNVAMKEIRERYKE